ncbi:MAG: 50S ribosomal protein L24 [Acidobacteriota bacterium]|nr:MAG: 50S ribosomal protein L24 [Acidobacteriota bacterium]
MARMHARKGDTVTIMAGTDKGKTGKVLRVFVREGRAVVEGVRFVKKHVRPNPRRNIKGGIVQKEATVPLSNLMVVCSGCKRPARVGIQILEDGRRVRQCKRCKEHIVTP